MAFEITNKFLENLTELIATTNNPAITELFEDLHYADIAEVLDELD
jgi:magnesium transporter